MFTGIIEAVGQIERIRMQGGDAHITVATGALDMHDVKIGDSIATSGVCLTVAALSRRSIDMHVSAATLSCTVGLDTPRAVNLEKALRLDSRLGGHLVSGHVDGIGRVVRFDPAGDCVLLSVRAPHALSRYIASKGSIAVDGVSLTVNTVEGDTFSINLIPHTLQATTLNHLGIGSRVNLEVDQIARYADRVVQWEGEKEPA